MNECPVTRPIINIRSGARCRRRWLRLRLRQRQRHRGKRRRSACDFCRPTENEGSKWVAVTKAANRNFDSALLDVGSRHVVRECYLASRSLNESRATLSRPGILYAPISRTDHCLGPYGPFFSTSRPLIVLMLKKLSVQEIRM